MPGHGVIVVHVAGGAIERLEVHLDAALAARF